MNMKDINYVHKHYLLDQRKLKTLKKLLRLETETDVLNHLMDEALYAGEMQRVKQKIRGKGHLKDVFVSP